MNLTDSIDAVLPQTQCTQCGYDGCRPYAQAMAAGRAAINRCPPGGESVIRALAELLDTPVLALDPAYGVHQALTVALIDEEHCIGCTLCIQACPVDAIVGANQLMHTVLSDQCTGCERCVAPCPVDCITMIPAEREWLASDAQQARQNFEWRNARLQRRHDEAVGPAARTLSNKPALSAAAKPEDKRARIAQALARARAKRQ